MNVKLKNILDKLIMERIMEFQESIEYRVLPIPFTVLTLCGTWYPENWPNKKKRIYRCLTVLLLLLGIVLFVEMVTFLVFTSKKDNIDLENIFAVIAIAIGLYKKINILYHRQKLVDFITNYTNNQWHSPNNVEEAMIHLKIQSETRYISYIYAIFILVSILFRSITPIIESGTFIILPLDGWYPYNVENLMAFSLTYLHQIVSGVTLTCMHISTDTLFVGLLLQMNCQLNILKHRLRELGNSQSCVKSTKFIDDNEDSMNTAISQRVREHESIFRFGYDLQKTFKPILMAQMVVVVPSVIINVYFLSIYTDRFNLKYFMTFFFALVSLMQIYMFCWYGNEIVLSSSDVGDALYECNWFAFNQSTKKIMLTIITRTSRTFLLSAVEAIPLDIDTFIKIMKTSYSAFNLLQRTTAQ